MLTGTIMTAIAADDPQETPAFGIDKKYLKAGEVLKVENPDNWTLKYYKASEAIWKQSLRTAAIWIRMLRILPNLRRRVKSAGTETRVLNTMNGYPMQEGMNWMYSFSRSI